MSDELEIEGKIYISSKRASEMSGYAQDYIGQLSRASLVDGKRIGGLWYVSMESLDAYRAKSEANVPIPPPRQNVQEPETLLTFDGKEYVSASRASKITGYHQDYIGQLARTGKILSRQIGNRWYVHREGLLKHKAEKDALLAAVQAESVGIPLRTAGEIPKTDEEPYFRYFRDEETKPLLRHAEEEEIRDSRRKDLETPAEHSVPIRVLSKSRILYHDQHVKRVKYSNRMTGNTMFSKSLGLTAFSAVILFFIGIALFRFNVSGYVLGSYKKLAGAADKTVLIASAYQAFTYAGDILERVVVPEIIYRRPANF